MTLRARAVALLVAIALIVGQAGLVSASVQDVIGTRFEEAVLYLQQLGVVEGRPDGFYPQSPIQRDEATKIIIEILGQGDLAVLLSGAPSFPDVPSSHWASGYIALAKNLGIVNGFEDGTFRPGELVTYAQFAKMLVEAAGLSPTPGYLWPVNYVDAALKAGMLTGIAFQADLLAIRGDCALMTAYTVRNVPDPATGKTLEQRVFGALTVATLELSPSTRTVSMGTPVEYTVVAKDNGGNVVEGLTISFTTSDPARSVVTADGRFFATAPGSYTVTASVGSIFATAAVEVYGTPVALRAIASPSSIAANGTATSTITVEVVDSQGTRVSTATHTISISHHEDQGAVTLPSALTKDASNGTASFVVTATLLDGVTDTLELTAAGLTTDHVTVKTVEPIASSLKLTANPTELPANTATVGDITCEVMDQQGQPMHYGTYYITFSISGKGLLEGGTEPLIIATSGQQAVVQVSSIQGQTGSFSITARATSLGSRSVTIPTYIAGVPKGLRVTGTDLSGQAGEINDMHLTVRLVDSNGRTTKADQLIVAEFVPPDGSGLEGLAPVVFNIDDSYHTIDFYGTKSGQFRVTVRDENTADPAVSSTTFDCTVAAGEIDHIGLTPEGDPVVFVPLGSPRLAFTAQLLDAEENQVARSGVKLQFDAEVSGLGSYTWSVTSAKVTTDSNGRATITFIGQGYVGNEYTISAAADLDNDGDYDDAFGSTAPWGIHVTDRVPAGLSIAFKDLIGDPISNIAADAGEKAYVTVTVLDSYGTAIELADLDVEITFSNEGRNVLPVSVTLVRGTLGPVQEESYVHRFLTTATGDIEFTFEGGLAGLFSVTAKCLNAASPPSKSGSFRTVAGDDWTTIRICKTDFTLAEDMTIRDGSQIQLRLAVLDNGGNPVGIPSTTTVFLTPDRLTGAYRLTSGGMTVTQVELVTGTSYRTIYYIDSEDGSDVDLYDDVTW